MVPRRARFRPALLDRALPHGTVTLGRNSVRLEAYAGGGGCWSIVLRVCRGTSVVGWVCFANDPQTILANRQNMWRTLYPQWGQVELVTSSRYSSSKSSSARLMDRRCESVYVASQLGHLTEMGSQGEVIAVLSLK